HGDGRALPAGSDGLHPDLHPAQARRGAGHVRPPAARAGPPEHVRRDGLPGGCDGGDPGPRRVHPRRSGRAVLRGAQEDPREARRAEGQVRLRAIRNGVHADVIEAVWKDFEPFARYGFNRAHAAIYGIIAYNTAYLKANYTTEYMTAVLSAEMGTPDRIAIAVAECRRMGLAVLPPDVNESELDFAI